MKLRPLQDRVAVRRVKEEEKTKGGLFIPDTAKEKPVEAVVLSVGNGRSRDEPCESSRQGGDGALASTRQRDEDRPARNAFSAEDISASSRPEERPWQPRNLYHASASRYLAGTTPGRAVNSLRAKGRNGHRAQLRAPVITKDGGRGQGDELENRSRTGREMGRQVAARQRLAGDAQQRHRRPRHYREGQDVAAGTTEGPQAGLDKAVRG